MIMTIRSTHPLGMIIISHWWWFLHFLLSDLFNIPANSQINLLTNELSMRKNCVIYVNVIQSKKKV